MQDARCFVSFPAICDGLPLRKSPDYSFDAKGATLPSRHPGDPSDTFSIDPLMRALDAHVHLWRRDDGEDFSMREKIPALDRDFTEADLRAARGSCGVGGAIVVQAMHNVGEILRLGLSFMTVIAAEFIAAQTGVGYMIFSARLFAQTEYVFLGIIVLGCMGFAANWLLRKLLSRIAYRYDVKL